MVCRLIPPNCKVLVVGGGPGGSYAATVLAREGVDVVLLEADVFPRYHIGESMLASVRYFLRLVELEETFERHGFAKKVGAAFKLNHDKPEGWTDFRTFSGPDFYSWNVIRSESDHILFKHAAECGAHTFDGVRVEGIEFSERIQGVEEFQLGRPIAASWRKKDGTSGNISFEYLIDASGRQGIVSTKYMKNRKHNQGLKNIAKWGYWSGAKEYGLGTNREGAPFFEALTDGSGWVWKIPLHNGTTSVGVVMRQDLAAAKREQHPDHSEVDFYRAAVNMAPNISEMLVEATLTTKITGASDWSYSASTYASPNLRIVGDAGCFIDPFFSSGVHLALTSALSAAITIQAARNGDCDEPTAAQWHSDRVAEGYHRFLLVVLTSLRQIRGQAQPLLNDFDEQGFDKAFAAFRPIIQGTADTEIEKKLTQKEVEATIDFCLSCNAHISQDDERKIQERLLKIKNGDDARPITAQDLAQLTAEERDFFRIMAAKQMVRLRDTSSTGGFETVALNGFKAKLEKGRLGLAPIGCQA